VRPLSARDVLWIWEHGEGQHPVDRALTILAAGCPELSRDELAALPVGERDTLLLALRIRTLGAALQGQGECPACAEQIEIDVPVRTIVEGGAAGAAGGRSRRNVTCQVDGMELSLRPPNSHDLAAAAACRTVDEAGRILLQRAVLSATRDGAPVQDMTLSAEAVEQIAARIEEADPNAEIRMTMLCPRCGHEFQLPFDVVSFFWSEIAAQARRLFHEVHILARAYGWEEANILSMTPRRRSAYLDMVEA
jgi:hypothetical protein